MGMSILQFTEHLAAAKARLANSRNEALEAIGAHVADKSRELIGHENNSWPELAESTIADKERHGYGVPNPLLRTGGLKESISHRVDGERVVVGSTDKIAVYQELGTERIPPRSFLVKAALDSEREVVEIAREFGHRAIVRRE